MKISPSQSTGTQTLKNQKHPRPLILAFMLTGVLTIQAYPAFLKTVIESAGMLVSPSSVSVASMGYSAPAPSDSSVSEESINQVEYQANHYHQAEASVCQGDQSCASPKKPSTYKVLPTPLFERHTQTPQLKSPIELPVELVNYDLHSQAQPPNPMSSLPPAVALAVRQDLSTQTGISPEKLTITEVERQTWPNSCLGLAQPDEFCGQMLVEGWRVVLSNGRQTWVYRTDLKGQVFRLEQNQSVSNLPISVANQVFQDAANRSGLPHSGLRIVEAQSQTWPDGCLGLGEPGTLCTLALVPGWQVKISSGRQAWVYRTNESGSLVRLDESASQFNDSARLRLLNITDSQLLSPRTQNWVWQAIAFCGITDTTYETLFGKTCNDPLKPSSELF